nr:translation initiation factor 1 [Arenaria serpyllifolia]UTE94292.1 translation initiation factor 1 [Arenaria serpyllifolia]
MKEQKTIHDNLIADSRLYFIKDTTEFATDPTRG